MTSKQPLFEHAENHRDSNDASLKSDLQSGNVSLMTNTSRNRLPLRITQDNNRLTINLATHDPDLSQDSNSTCRKSNGRVKSATVCSMNSACLTPQAPRRTTGTNSDAAAKKSGIPVAMKAKKNEHLIKIIQENCDKKRVLPCDAFVVPLLALSDYYSSDGYKMKTNTANLNTEKKSKFHF